jgi:hypothetical protein
MSQETEPSEKQVDYAYEVLSTLMAAEDKVAQQPEKMQQLINETVAHMPEIFDALMTITKREHRRLIYQLFKTTINLFKQIKK